MNCDICDAEMEMSGERGVSVQFRCGCGQTWMVSDCGCRCIILKTLWPAMEKSDPAYLAEFLPDWRRKNIYFLELQKVSGFMSDAEFNQKSSEVTGMYEAEILLAESAIAAELASRPVPWWKSVVKMFL